MPDESKAGLKPGRSWFEINPTCSPVYITEDNGLIFHKPYIHKVLPISGLNRRSGRPACRYNSDASARLRPAARDLLAPARHPCVSTAFVLLFDPMNR